MLLKLPIAFFSVNNSIDFFLMSIYPVYSVSVGPECKSAYWFDELCGRWLTANEQPGEDVRLPGGSIIKPCGKVPRQNESQSDLT